MEQIKKEHKINQITNFKINKQDIIVGNIARLEEQKNPLEFFKIAKSINEKDKNFKFLIGLAMVVYYINA